jgi:hypothetical protein
MFFELFTIQQLFKIVRNEIQDPMIKNKWVTLVGTLFLTYLESLGRSSWDNFNHTLKYY